MVTTNAAAAAAANAGSTPMDPKPPPVAMSTGGTPATGLFGSPNTSLPSLTQATGGKSQRQDCDPIRKQYTSMFMRMMNAYVVNFSGALHRLGVDVVSVLGVVSGKMDEMEARQEADGMRALYKQVEGWEKELGARKGAWEAAGGADDGEGGEKAARETSRVALRNIVELAGEIEAGVRPMETDEVERGRDGDREPAAGTRLEIAEAEMEHEMARLRSPTQEEREREKEKEKEMDRPKDIMEAIVNVDGSARGDHATTTASKDASSSAKPEVKPELKMPPVVTNGDALGETIVLDDEDNQRIDVDEREDETTYAKYVATGIRELHPLAREHPDPLVETASLRSVPMPALGFNHCLKEEVEAGIISDAQLETVIYANMRFNQPERPRMGFFLGDGAGVGKGRQIAALCKQHWHDGGRRILWVSVSQDLRIDTKRDLKDVNAEFIPVHSDGSPEPGWDGVVFCTYSFLRMKLPKPAKKPKRNFGASQKPEETDEVKMERLEAIPASCNLGKLIKWLSKCAEGSLIVLDESHKAKNLLPATSGGQPTQTGRAIMYLQERLPDAKVLYSSATGASEPKNLAYMHRLGIGGVGNTSSLVEMLSKADNGTLELAAMSMKSAGAYLGRTLSYDGAEFDLVRVKLEDSFEIMYNRCSPVWATLYKIGQAFGEKMWPSKYWGANQRFFKSMLMAGKVPAITKMAKEALLDGMCVVIGLQSTGEAATQQARAKKDEEEMNELISAPRMSLTKCVSMLVKYDGLVDSLEKDMTKNGMRYDPKMGYAACDRITRIIEVHEQTYNLARKIMQQPPISLIKLERPDAGSHVPIEEIRAKLEAKMAEFNLLDSDKRRTNLQMIASKDPEEKAALREKVEKLEHEFTTLNSAVAVLQAAESDARNDVGVFGRRSSINIQGMDVDNAAAVREVPVPVMLLEPYVRPEPTAELGANEADGGHTMEDLEQICQEITEMFDFIAERLDLPANPLDDLIHNLGGQEAVAELTGRKGGIFFDEGGNAEYRDRKAGDSQFKKCDVNLYEKDLFMRGEKLVAIISDASSTGISLQADRRVKNLRRRCHITLELPWSADKAIQQFGRSHRANQMSAPVYKMVVTPCGGEYRFACAASKRLASLGALLRGDRNALGAGSDLKAFDIDSELGKKALRKFLLSFCSKQLPTGGRKIAARALPEDLALDLENAARLSPTEQFLNYFFHRFRELGLEINPNKLDVTVPTFLNRLLGFTIMEQDIVFKYFAEVMEHQREIMINDGTLERGILSMDVEATLKETHVVHENTRTQSKIYHHVVSTDRGKSWNHVKDRLADTLRAFGSIAAVAEFSGFYIRKNAVSGKDVMYTLNGEKVPMIKLVTVNPNDKAAQYKTGETTQYLNSFTIFPNSEFPKTGKLEEEMSNHRRATIVEAADIWTKWYDYMDTGCRHGDTCAFRMDHGECAMTRRTDLHLLTGGLLEFFTRLHDLTQVSNFIGRTYKARSRDGKEETKRHPLEIVRVVTDTGDPVVGYKAVSRAEMEYFKHQLLLPPGHPDDIVAQKKGSAHIGQAEERKRKEQERAQRNLEKQRLQKQQKHGYEHIAAGAPRVPPLPAAGATGATGATPATGPPATTSGAATAQPDFILSESYEGLKAGYTYKRGSKGMGYYRNGTAE